MGVLERWVPEIQGRDLRARSGRARRALPVAGIALMLSFACRDRGQGAPPVMYAANLASAPPSTGVWVGREELAALPTSGPAWEALQRDAARDPGSPAVADQHSTHDVHTMAAALVCARTGQHCDKARAELLSAVGTEQGADWHSVSRNLGGYVIAADVLGLRADGDPSSAGTRIHAWIASFLTRTDIRANAGEPADGERGIAPFHSGSNSAAQEGFIHAAVAAYAGDRAALDRAWDAFRTFACDPSAPDRERIDLDKGVETGWAHDDDAPCAINPKGTTKVVPSGRRGAGSAHRIDGAIINDMRRGGAYQWPPGWTQYPWVGIEGLVPAAVVLHRAGYPTFAVADRAVLRTLEYLRHLREQTGHTDWFDGRRAAETVVLVNRAYGTQFPVDTPVGAGRLVGYTDWTHARWQPQSDTAATP